MLHPVVQPVFLDKIDVVVSEEKSRTLVRVEIHIQMLFGLSKRKRNLRDTTRIGFITDSRRREPL